MNSGVIQSERVRIVLVDDHAMLREGLRLRLQKETDFSVVDDASNAAEAYASLERHAPDVVVLDVQLPGESGIAATKQIRARWPDTRIIVLTGSIESELASDAMIAGANGFLHKVNAGDDLARAIRVVMAGQTYLSAEGVAAVAEALRRQNEPARGPALSERELEVLRGMADGLSYKEIGGALGLSPKSVETYRARLARKIGFTTRVELVRYALRCGLVPA